MKCVVGKAFPLHPVCNKLLLFSYISILVFVGMSTETSFQTKLYCELKFPRIDLVIKDPVPRVPVPEMVCTPTYLVSGGGWVYLQMYTYFIMR